MRRAARRDANESAIMAPVSTLGGLWVPSGPFDGWLWDRSAWRLCEVKDPRKEGWASEFTADQTRLLIRLRERSIPVHVLRTQDDVLALMGARRTA
jgi:hypothetical protein